MMIRTHLAISVLGILLFLPHVSNEIIFVVAVLVATFLPDIDTGFSTIGKLKASRFINFFLKHRGLFHSLTFCIIISGLFAFFFPILALPFFLGYGIHLLADSFTAEGIRPFWPLRQRSNWKIRTGGYTDTSLFVAFLLVDIFVFIFFVINVF